MKNTFPPQYYRDYLQLDKILGAQVLQSEVQGDPAHDEMLFIIIHQSYELWFKQILWELGTVIDVFNGEAVAESAVALSTRRVNRANKILDVLIPQFDILETMTALDFADFREYLNPASGFQSAQFRLLELSMGLKDAHRMNIGREKFHSRLDDADRSTISSHEDKPTLFESVEKWLERLPFTENTEGDFTFWEEYRKAVEALYERDRTRLVQSNDLDEANIEPQLKQIEASLRSFDAILREDEYNKLLEAGARRLSFKATRAALFIMLYRDFPLLNMPFQFLTALTEFDEKLSIWRYRHAQMVSRMIGSKIGTGGSTGHDYLVRASMQHKVFSDITSMSSYLIARKELPELPDNIQAGLHFAYEQ